MFIFSGREVIVLLVSDHKCEKERFFSICVGVGGGGFEIVDFLL